MLQNRSDDSVDSPLNCVACSGLPKRAVRLGPPPEARSPRRGHQRRIASVASRRIAWLPATFLDSILSPDLQSG